MELLYFKIGIIVTVLGCLFLQTSYAEQKRKKVIIKVPSKINHVYHHHTQKVHIHKHPVKTPSPKPKPKQEPVIKVIKIQEEFKWKPERKPDWKSDQWQAKVHQGRSRKGPGGPPNWKGRRGFVQKSKPNDFPLKYKNEKQSDYEESGAEETQVQEDYYGGGGWTQYGDYGSEWDHQTKGRFEEYSDVGGGRRKGRKSKFPAERGERGTMVKGRKKNCDYEEQSLEATSIQEDWGKHNQKKNRLSSKKRVPLPHQESKRRYRRPHFEEDKYIGPDDYDDGYTTEAIWPDKKEHPSWHHYKHTRSHAKEWTIPVAEKHEENNNDNLSKYSGGTGNSDISFDDYINSGEFVPSVGPFRGQWDSNTDATHYFPNNADFEIQPHHYDTISKSATSVSPASYYNELLSKTSPEISPTFNNNENHFNSVTQVTPSFFNNDHLGITATNTAPPVFSNDPPVPIANIAQPVYNNHHLNNNANNNQANQFHYNNEPVDKGLTSIAQPFHNNVPTINNQNDYQHNQNDNHNNPYNQPLNNNQHGTHYNNEPVNNNQFSSNFNNNNNNFNHQYNDEYTHINNHEYTHINNPMAHLSSSYYNNEVVHQEKSNNPKVYDTTPAFRHDTSTRLPSTPAQYHYNKAIQDLHYQITTPIPPSRFSTSAYDTNQSKNNGEFAVVYHSHIGHKTNGTGPSSSYQEVKFGDIKRIRPRLR